VLVYAVIVAGGRTRVFHELCRRLCRQHLWWRLWLCPPRQEASAGRTIAKRLAVFVGRERHGGTWRSLKSDGRLGASPHAVEGSNGTGYFSTKYPSRH